MRGSTHRFRDSVVTVYYLNEGEKVLRHSHRNEHTTCVSQGRSRVEIWQPNGSSEVFFMKPGDPDYVLPGGLHHEVTSVEDETVVVHILDARDVPDAPVQSPGKSGGVMLVDGSVVHGD